MNDDVNDIRINNDDPVDNEVHITNDDVPYNEAGVSRDNPGYSEFGPMTSGRETVPEGSVRFSDYDVMKVASAFVVVSLVAMTVVLDDSPFGTFFDPIMGAISESFGISGVDSDYEISCEITLESDDTSVSYAVVFDEEPEGDVYLVVSQGTSVIKRISLDDLGSGIVDGLVPGTAFRFAVTVNGTTVGERTVSTTGTYDGSPIVTLLSAESRTAVDRDSAGDGGYFTFRMSVIDRDGAASGFRYSLVLADGSATVCADTGFTGSVTDQQKVLVPDSLIPETITAPVAAVLTVTWDEGSSSESLNETVYL